MAYNSALAACERGNRWAESLQLLEIMRKRQVAPDLVSYSSVVATCQAAGTSLLLRIVFTLWVFLILGFSSFLIIVFCGSLSS